MQTYELVLCLLLKLWRNYYRRWTGVGERVQSWSGLTLFISLDHAQLTLHERLQVAHSSPGPPLMGLCFMTNIPGLSSTEEVGPSLLHLQAMLTSHFSGISFTFLHASSQIFCSVLTLGTFASKEMMILPFLWAQSSFLRGL